MFTTYSASAGSGKTFSLVVDYLTICFKNLCPRTSHDKHPSASSREEFRKILAMTFTNNAALEMKKRILDVLNEFAFTPTDQRLPEFNDYYEKIVKKVFGEDADEHDPSLREKICHAARLQLQTILYDYDRFSVTTIDKFYQKVIRSSALRLGLNLNYSVEIDLGEFYQLVVDKVMDDLKKGDPLTDRLLKALSQDMDVSGKSDIQQFLLDTLDLLYKNAEDNYQFLKRLRKLDNQAFEDHIKEWQKDVYETIPDAASKKKTLTAELLQLLEEKTGEPKDGVNQNVYKAVGKWVANPKLFISAENAESNYKNVCKLVNGAYLNKNKHLDPATEAEILKKAQDLQVWMNDELKRYFNELLVLKYANKLLIIFDIQQRMDDLKALRGLFFLSEANIILHENLSALPPGVSPEIYEKQGFHYFFLDEFQDTSLMQWHNIKPLIENNAIAGRGDAFLFGDVKQAIYHWRNGDAEILHDLSSYPTQNQHGHGFPTLAEDNYHMVPLQTNFRSQEAVIKFNNEFFKVWAKELGFHDQYKDVEQLVPDKEDKHGGLVQTYLHGEDPVTKDSVKSLPDSFSKLKEFVENNDPLNAKHFQILYAVQDALNRGYACKDILLLFRRNDFLSEVAQLLINYGMRVETKKSLSLDQAPEVMAILETLRLLLNPHDRLVQAKIIHALSQIMDIGDAYTNWILKLQDDDSDNFSLFIEEHFGQPLALNEWRKEPLFITILNIIKTYRLDEMGSPFLNDFLDFVLNYLANRKDDVEDLLNRWDYLKKSKKIPSVQSFAKQDAITLMTIHGSKGMQHPVVIYPIKQERAQEIGFWTIDPTDNSTAEEERRIAYVKSGEKSFSFSDLKDDHLQKKQEVKNDALNVAYVAHTRAVDLLYLIIEAKENPKGTDHISVLQNFVLHAKTKSGDPFFTKDDDIPHHFYAGDETWTKPKKEEKDKEKTVAKMVTPAMGISDFSLQELVMPEMIPADDPRSIGTKVHDFLSRFSAFPQSEEEAKEVEQTIPEEIRPYVMNFFRQILQDEELKRFFGPEAKVYNEVSILLPDGNTRRPDRVSMLEDKVRVYDYKTGHDDADYQKQLDEYCQLIREMGYEDVQGRLLFVI